MTDTSDVDRDPDSAGGRYEIVSGAGRLTRRGEAVVWATPDADDSTWAALLELADLAPGTDPAGADTAQSMRSAMADLDAQPTVGFAVLLVRDGRGQALLRGPADLRNEGGPAPASGYGSVGVSLPFPLVEPVYVGYSGATGGPEHPWLDFRDGVVPADGVWVHPVPQAVQQDDASTSYQDDVAAAYPTAGQTATDHPVVSDRPPFADSSGGAGAYGAAVAAPAFVVDALSGGATAAGAAGAAAALAGAGLTAAPVISPAPPAPQTSAPSPEPAPEPSPSRPAPPPGAEAPHWASPGPDVSQPSDGFSPAADHLRIDLRDPHPSQVLPPLPPIPPAAPHASAARREPETGGVLVFDDGSTFALDQDYVVGRKPERHALVQSGQARPLTVVDPDTVLSGAHAALRRQQGRVYLEDLGSLNGSHIALPGATEWTRIPPHQPIALEPGTRLLFGWTVATFSGAR